MSDLGMLRLTRQNAIQNLRGLLFPRVALVICHHPSRDKRQRIEDAGFIIGRMVLVKLLHRIVVSERAGPMIELVSVLVKNLDRRDVVSLALSPCARDLCLFHRARSLLQLDRGWRSPEGMVLAHGDAPESHAALRVGDGNVGERLFSRFILERMEPGDRAIELPPGSDVAGDWEIDLPKFL